MMSLSPPCGEVEPLNAVAAPRVSLYTLELGFQPRDLWPQSWTPQPTFLLNAANILAHFQSNQPYYFL